MAAITTTSRGPARVESRPRAGTVVVQVGGTTLLSLTSAEARELAEHLAVCADAVDEGAAEVATIARSKPLALQQAVAA
ncbi:hypothetical protein B9Y60_14650 [Stenotrophomonas maltophilia]|uniref:hypothetical protein n=1 Tax=Stenotrophomonas maltophilia TaxID=40324 RepID=UPI000C26B426|nr:hypothetical protein [Stenotrophomonas maltophilia]PJL51023.1 hypothetical protein B9Y73_14650 [Stenotrophomonas maltophilia]PJL54599.1 hypothetical protein B9Y60_14650 [Stenotrophomonas maltophilia]